MTIELLTTAKAADALSVSRFTVRQLILAGERVKSGEDVWPEYLRAINISKGTTPKGKRWRVERSEVEAYIQRIALCDRKSGT